VVAFDRATGKQQWIVEISSGGFPAKNHPKNTAATSTIACDGERLIVTFFHHKTVTATALDLGGKKLWTKTVGPFDPKRYEYGFAPSPLLYRDMVIVATEYDGDSALTALNRKDGERAWRTARPKNISFSSPVVAHVAGRDQLLISGADQVASYDPASGAELWTAPGTAAATCGTVIWEGDTVFASGGYPKSETLAIKADGKGEVLWSNRQKCYEQSMMVTGGHVYALTGNGVLFCWNAADGEERWTKRLRGPVSASPVLAGGHIYWANELGMLYVFQANGEKCELVAENQLDDESFASPAIVDGRIYLRTAKHAGGKRQEYLTCIGK
jgi:outer membrane protein assembly factor BamB